MLLAGQIRQSNRIASAVSELQLTETYNTLQIERASNPDFAKLYPKLAAPEKHLMTATETSQIRGIAWHYVNVMRAAQSAYENGLLTREARDAYRADLSYQIERLPGIRPHIVFIYENLTTLHGKEIFDPITQIRQDQSTEEKTE